jgi:hypothetical protein
MTLKQAIKTEQELHDLAINRFLDKIDWDLSEWLSDKEWDKYQKAIKIIEGE